MLILGVDTSGKNGGIVLVHCETEASRTLELVPLEGGTFSAQLVPQIAALLEKHGITKHQIGAFAVVSGPGSFTGLRVGLAAIKALAEILKKPIAVVSRLEASVLGSKREGRVTAVLDAGRGEVYAGTYSVQGERANCLGEEILSTGSLLERAAGETVVAADPKLADLLNEHGVKVIRIQAPRADAIASIAFHKLQCGEAVTPEALDATYIRRSDAETKFARPTLRDD
ncbi:MAG TPA: tRNA (adenosine(37)-N6)-threonylcarbamoyltransferase complex dimerization subunit type 1 TsaB [Terriglobales bacterium]|jgi:tRNA threonylcarbamoyladenosine biosynthesis protein TsaB|nr:tRNA (adenosine(37)-N6)-threonylcarbamoyltransferase complex dimerization subunit type 1 TsaB [Terriglobales bacterium]